MSDEEACGGRCSLGRAAFLRVKLGARNGQLGAGGLRLVDFFASASERSANFGNKPDGFGSYPAVNVTVNVLTFFRPPAARRPWCTEKNPEPKIPVDMNKSTKTLLMAAAIAGLYAGALTVKATAAETGTKAPTTEKGKDACKGKEGCKAKESCKGKDTCKSADGKDTCKAKESCKAKEACKSKDGCKAADKKSM